MDKKLYMYVETDGGCRFDENDHSSILLDMDKLPDAFYEDVEVYLSSKPKSKDAMSLKKEMSDDYDGIDKLKDGLATLLALKWDEHQKLMFEYFIPCTQKHGNIDYDRIYISKAEFNLFGYDFVLQIMSNNGDSSFSDFYDMSPLKIKALYDRAKKWL